MTPAQRQYDIDLVAAMQRVAVLVEPRSRKMSDMLRVAATRIAALSAIAPLDEEVQLDASGNQTQPQVKRSARPHAQPIKLQPRTKIKSSPRQRRTKNR